MQCLTGCSSRRSFRLRSTLAQSRYGCPACHTASADLKVLAVDLSELSGDTVIPGPQLMPWQSVRWFLVTYSIITTATTARRAFDDMTTCTCISSGEPLSPRQAILHILRHIHAPRLYRTRLIQFLMITSAPVAAMHAG